jgi:two-component system, chemotaxis family, CheB/CheR fusion protein
LSLILAVDDEKSGLYFRKLILEHAGYSVLSATTPDEAMELFRSHPVDLVITDHLLGRKTGNDMSRDMKLIKPAVPIVMLSGTRSMPEQLEHADAFLSKTEGPDELLVIVGNLLCSAKAGQISEGEKAETAPLQALLAAIVEDSDDAIFSKTADGRILTWNKAAQEMYGYRPEEIIGKNVSILVPPDRPAEVDEILQRVRRGERLQHFETTRLTKDGRVLQVSLTISPVRNSSGKVIAASSIARDVTQVKRAEEALRNSERLAIGGRMAATIAHEINNPLETVTNILYLLGRNPKLDDSARGYIKVADEELKRVGQITRTTLGMYRDRDAAAVPVNVVELLKTILMLYQRQLQAVGGTVETRFRSAITVRGVSGELRQVFSNLIANAIDALELTGTRMFVRVRPALDWKNSKQPGIKVTVADDGPGMSAETLSNLFKAFYTTKGQRGTGVGLWVSQGIVAKHGGWMRVRSRTGSRHGTCFVVFLPEKL